MDAECQPRKRAIIRTGGRVVRHGHLVRSSRLFGELANAENAVRTLRIGESSHPGRCTLAATVSALVQPFLTQDVRCCSVMFTPSGPTATS